MSLLIVGATGTLGRQIARQALDEGYQVRCLVRGFNRASFLRKWGAELVRGDLCDPATLPPALEGVTHVIDAATARVTDSLGVRQVDWEGKVALIQAAKEAGVERFVFCSIINNRDYPQVPLMEIKRCTEEFLAESGLNYTVLQLCGFMQGLIGQYAIPILDNQTVWITGNTAPVAYANSQDVAKFAVRALSVPETENQTFPVVGTRAWSAEEIVALCERLSGRTAKITRTPLGLLRVVRKAARFFQWGWNVADRLAFAEVLASGTSLTADMTPVYPVFGIDPKEMTTLEEYMQEYHSRILKKLKEIEYEQEQQKARKKRQRSPFKSSK
ncbi:SDR family oxidoreductase [Baaleninema sp.]|uniref:SDR family oxidoreductase n=1 Tax=Baaleninema sp. TaxID=3101197 RepID=UPI003D048C69